VAVLSESPGQSRDIQELLRSPFQPTVLSVERFRDVEWSEFDAFVIDACRMGPDEMPGVAAMIAVLSHQGGPLGLVIGGPMKKTLAALSPLSDVETFHRPMGGSNLDRVFARALANRPKADAVRQKTRSAFLSIPQHADALCAADDALERIFALGRRPGTLDMPRIDEQSGKIIDSLGRSGVSDWIAGVRQHHDSTYQHCLLVTGTAVAFGQQLGFRSADLRRIALGALMHDLGKARIPVSILDKPGELTDEERRIIQTHPRIGVELLDAAHPLAAELEDIILKHHEFLDGTGYPEGLGAADISDIVRLITVADVFSALIEKRPYRAPLSGADAYGVLKGMGGKIDQAILRAIRPSVFTAAG
jgi:putative nucleotidyltransferase with HDIG domain